MSAASAFSGDTYTTAGPTLSARSPCRYSRSMQTRNEARVLPEPVGAVISVCPPAATSGTGRATTRLGFCIMIESWTTSKQTGRKPSSEQACIAV
jgi:hypothetical protein